MMKIKYILLLVCVAACFASCKKSNSAEEQFSADTTAIRSFVNANKIAVQKDNNGIFYQVIKPGAGSTVTTSSTVTVNYTGKVLGKTSNFDSSNGTARAFPLSQLIQGWQIGIPYIQKGGSIRLFIPSKYGYGEQDQSAIPANSVLDFTIDLVDVK